MVDQGVNFFACHNCGSPVAPGSPTCPHCGIAFGAPAQPQAPPQAPPAYPPSSDAYARGPVPPGQAQVAPPFAPQTAAEHHATWGGTPPPPSKSGGNKALLVIILVLLVLVAAGGAGYYLLVVSKPQTATSTTRPTPTSTSPGTSPAESPTASGGPIGTGGGTGNPTPSTADLTAQRDIEAAAQSERSYYAGAQVFTEDGTLLTPFDPTVVYGAFGGREVRLAIGAGDAQTVCIGAQSSSGKRYWIGLSKYPQAIVPYYTTSPTSIDHGANCSAELVKTWSATKAGWM